MLAISVPLKYKRPIGVGGTPREGEENETPGGIENSPRKIKGAAEDPVGITRTTGDHYISGELYSKMQDFINNEPVFKGLNTMSQSFIKKLKHHSSLPTGEDNRVLLINITKEQLQQTQITIDINPISNIKRLVSWDMEVAKKEKAKEDADAAKAKAAADGRCNSLEAEVDSLRGSQTTWQRQKQQLEQRVEDLKVELQITQQSGGGSGDSVAKRDVEMMAAVKDAKIEAMEAQMLENALRFAAEIAELESRNMELGMDARRGSTAGVPQSR
mgnify:CR=1 FL=1